MRGKNKASLGPILKTIMGLILAAILVLWFARFMGLLGQGQGPSTLRESKALHLSLEDSGSSRPEDYYINEAHLTDQRNHWLGTADSGYYTKNDQYQLLYSNLKDTATLKRNCVLYAVEEKDWSYSNMGSFHRSHIYYIEPGSTIQDGSETFFGNLTVAEHGSSGGVKCNGVGKFKVCCDDDDWSSEGVIGDQPDWKNWELGKGCFTYDQYNEDSSFYYLCKSDDDCSVDRACPMREGERDCTPLVSCKGGDEGFAGPTGEFQWDYGLICHGEAGYAKWSKCCPEKEDESINTVAGTYTCTKQDDVWIWKKG